MLVGELMNPKPVVVSPEMPVPKALNLMHERKIHQFPVVDSHGHLVGIVTEQDLLHASAASVTTLTVWELPELLSKVLVETVMVKDVITATENSSVEEAACLMADKAIGCLPVMRGNKMVGLITKTDIFVALIELLGGRRSGVRVWASTAAAPGTIAKITSQIAGVHGNIVGLGYLEARDAKGSRWEMTVKVQDVKMDKLVEILKPVVKEILDIREN